MAGFTGEDSFLLTGQIWDYFTMTFLPVGPLETFWQVAQLFCSCCE